MELVERIDRLINRLSASNVETIKPELVSAVNELKRLFSEAKAELEKGAGVMPDFEELKRKLDQIIDQNKKIAKGILVIADMLEEKRVAKLERKEVPSAERKLPVRIPPPFEPEQGKKKSYLERIEEAFKK
ncbi:hypothetical protein DRJ16_02555 [Candidatus Woesearchaeota archaeon]|nr:MAG: hypothetical protein DRJ16_02555 [Candidatus Woesearchaeota archaeon]